MRRLESIEVKDGDRWPDLPGPSVHYESFPITDQGITTRWLRVWVLVEVGDGGEA